MCVCLLSALPQSSTPSYWHSSPLTWQELSDEVSCTVRVRLTERDLDSLQEAYIGGGIKGTDRDKTGRGHYMLGNSCSCSPSKRRPNLCSYSCMRLSGSELVGCWGSEYKGLAPDTCQGDAVHVTVFRCTQVWVHSGDLR